MVVGTSFGLPFAASDTVLACCTTYFLVRLGVIVNIIIPLVANCFAATNLYHTYDRYLVITSLEALEPWRLLL